MNKVWSWICVGALLVLTACGTAPAPEESTPASADTASEASSAAESTGAPAESGSESQETRMISVTADYSACEDSVRQKVQPVNLNFYLDEACTQAVMSAPQTTEGGQVTYQAKVPETTTDLYVPCPAVVSQRAQSGSLAAQVGAANDDFTIQDITVGQDTPCMVTINLEPGCRCAPTDVILEMNGGRFYADHISARTGNADSPLQCFTQWTAEINMADLDADAVRAGLEEATLTWESMEECVPVQGIALASEDGVTLHLITEENPS